MEAGPAEGGQQQAQRGNGGSLREQQLRQAAHQGQQRLGGGSGVGGGVTLCVVDSKYEVVKEAGRALGMRLVEVDDDRCNIYWVDTCVIGERFARMAPWQRINHFPGMAHIARKNRLAQNLATMRRRFPREYAFFPKTWVLPHDATDFRAQFDAEGRALARGVTYIVKPENSSKGRGIFLTKSLDAVAVAEPQVAQVYISRPLLLDGFKFDIRMYALVASCSPLRVYKYTDGLVRLCTSEYARPSASNLGDRFMHLTNSAINRLSDRYRKGHEAEGAEEEGGSKRSLRWFLDWVRRRYGEARAAALWKEMGEICVKTVLSILTTLVRDYKALFGPDAPATSDSKEGAEAAAAAVWGSRAFELLGFDIMVDQALKPWLIEVNTLPSFATDSEVDCEVKRELITETLSIVQAHPSDRRVYLERKKDEATQRLQRARLRADRLTHALQDEANVVVATRRRIEELFALHAPERMGAVERLMSKNKGREASLLCQLLRYFQQYGKGESSGGGATLGGGGGVIRRQGRWQGQGRRQEQDEWGMAAEGEGDGGYPSSLPSSRGGRREAVAVEAEAAGQEEGPQVTANGTSTSTSVAAGRNLAAVATGPLTEAEEMARLANFARIYPPPPGQPDTYAPLVEHVWEKEHKLLRGHTAATRLRAASLGKGGGAGSGSDEETLRRRLISRLSCGPAAEGSSEQPDDAPSLSGSSSAASIAFSTATSQQQRQEDALAVLDLLGKTKPLPGRRRSEADDTRLDRLLLSLVSDDRPPWRRSGSSCSLMSSSSSTTSPSLPSPMSPIKARQAAAAARLSRGYSSREEPPTASARLGVVVEGGLAGRVRANEQRAQERRQGLRCRHAGRTRPPAGIADPLPGFALLKPTILDLSVLEGGMEALSIPVSDRGHSRRKQPLSMHTYY